MSFEDNKALVQRFVGALNQGQMDIIDETISPDFYNYVPAAGEETAAEVLRQLSDDLRDAFPDLKIEVADFAEEDKTVTFSMTMKGTHMNSLWGAPGSGKFATWTSNVTTRFDDGKFAFGWNDLPLPSIMATLRTFDLVPPPEEMDQPPKHPIAIPEFILKVVMTGQVASKPCSHLDLIQVTEPSTDVCNNCVELGDIWPALRMCLICGFIGCCDTSKHKHMKQHYEETGHPIFRSVRMEESWVWCYEDDAFFCGKILEQVG